MTTISEMAKTLGVSKQAVRNRLLRRRIKPVYHKPITINGMTSVVGYYPDDTLTRISDSSQQPPKINVSDTYHLFEGDGEAA